MKSLDISRRALLGLRGVGLFCEWVLKDFESKRLYPSNSNRVPGYLFSINDASESINSMETAPPFTAIVCVTSMSVTMSQILLLISTESLSTPLSTILSSDTPQMKLLLPDF